MKGLSEVMMLGGEIFVVRVTVFLHLVLEFFVALGFYPHEGVGIAFAVFAMLGCVLSLIGSSSCCTNRTRVLFIVDAALNVLAVIGGFAGLGLEASFALGNGGKATVAFAWFAMIGVRAFRAGYAVICIRRGVGPLTLPSLIPLALMQLIYDGMHFFSNAIFLQDLKSLDEFSADWGVLTVVGRLDLAGHFFGMAAVFTFLALSRFVPRLGRYNRLLFVLPVVGVMPGFCSVNVMIDAAVTLLSFVLLAAGIGVFHNILYHIFFRLLANVLFHLMRPAGLAFLVWKLSKSSNASNAESGVRAAPTDSTGLVGAPNAADGL